MIKKVTPLLIIVLVIIYAAVMYVNVRVQGTVHNNVLDSFKTVNERLAHASDSLTEVDKVVIDTADRVAVPVR